MHAADAAGRKDLDAGTGSGDHRGSYRRGTGAPLGDREGEIGARDFHHVLFLREFLELFRLQADMQDAVNDGNRCRNGTLLTDNRLDTARHFDIAGVGHAVSDDRQFKRHQRRAALLCSGNLLGIGDRQEGGDRFRHCLFRFIDVAASMQNSGTLNKGKGFRKQFARRVFR